MLTKTWPSGSGQVLWVIVLPEARSMGAGSGLSSAGLGQPINRAGGQQLILSKQPGEELQHQQNGKVLRDTLLSLFCTFRLGRSQADRALVGRRIQRESETEG